MSNSLVLYHYVHCPFCIRVRMALGFLQLEYESKVLPYNDEKTPLSLTSVKMLPILLTDGVPQNESLEIISKLDTQNLLKMSTDTPHLLDPVLDEIAEFVHPLAMPYWIYTPEFDEVSRQYFVKKKSIKRGPFKDLVKNKAVYLSRADNFLKHFDTDLAPFFKSPEITILDILLASHLWGLYIVPEFQFPTPVHQYLQRVAGKCHFNYHEDYWR